MKLTIDFETRSAVDLGDCGAWVYSEDETTDVMCLAVKEDNRKPVIWVPPFFEYLLPVGHGLPLVGIKEIDRLIAYSSEIECHNAAFEWAIWKNCFSPKYLANPLPREKMRCSLAKASYHALPRGLEQLCKVLGVKVQKDMAGAAIMKKMCRPRRLTKAEWAPFEEKYAIPWKDLKEMQTSLYEVIAYGWDRVVDWDWRNLMDPEALLHWHEEPQDIVSLCRYCMTDTEAEHAASKALADLPESELKIWQLDQVINERGIRIDHDLASKITGMVEEHTSDLLDELSTITNGAVTSTKQTAKFRDFVNAHLPEEAQLDNIQAATVKAAIKDERVTGLGRRLLEIRRSLALSSISKYEAFRNRSCKDGIIRGSILYHGAGTGRFSGQGIQPHNFPRGKIKDIDLAISMAEADDFEGLKLFFGDVMVVASSSLRGCLIPREGNEFTCSDYSNIEGRVVAWLAGEEWKVQSFRDYDAGTGEDNYKLAYSRAFGIPVEQITKDNRQIGKVMELACGYQGGVGAFQTMASTYGVRVPDKQAKELVRLWRAAHPMIVALWAGLEDAAVLAVANPGRAYAYRGIAYRMSKCHRFLLCKLPSGRLLHYPYPSLATSFFYMDPETEEWHATKSEAKVLDLKAKGLKVLEKQCFSYWGVESQSKKWVKSHAYGGLLAENVTQAVSRDIMCPGMFNVEEAGYPVILTVHDEVLSEHPIGHGSVSEFSALLSMNPPWADGLPIAAAGWRGNRYKKD